MKRLLQVFKWLGIVVLFLVLLGAGGAFWFVTKSHPQIEGSARASGLQAQVQVIRDPLGVPHITAANVEDLFFAQGYVQAQDRLWQMELDRHIGHGTLAELFGAGQLDTDKFLRTMGLERAVRADWAGANPEEKRVLVAFAAGVSAFIDSHRDNLPLEFTLLGAKPEPWQPVDSLAWAKVMAEDLGGNRDEELLRASLIDKLGADKAAALAPAYPASGPFILSQPQPAGPATERPAATAINLSIGSPDLQAIAAKEPLPTGLGIGSNNWVVDGSKTTTGKPLLANDPHLGLQMPSIWYEVGLHCQPVSAGCPYDVVGMAFAATPGVVIGHNSRVAWGLTNVGPDVQDYFIEKVNPQNQKQYEFQGKWEDFQIVMEVLHVKGAADVPLEVKLSRHGPIMSGVLEGVTQPLALQWTATNEPSHLLGSVLAVDRAANFEEFRNALKDWNVPAQNFVYADIDGNIGYQMPGRVPIRIKGDGSVPAPGWTGEYEWKGYIPFEELPYAYNPHSHFIATANNAVVSSAYKYFITGDWETPYRAIRITELLQAKEKLSIEDIEAIQGDVYSIPLVRLQKSLTGFTFDKEKFLPMRAMPFVKSWDGKLDTESVGGSILEATYERLVRNTLANKMEPRLFDSYAAFQGWHHVFLTALLDQPDSAWWDDPTTAQKEARDDILRMSFEQGVDDLGRQFGDAPAEWRWGRFHTLTFEHPFGSQKPLDLIFNVGPIPLPGDSFTIDNAGFRYSKPFVVRSGSSMRLIQDLGDLTRSLQIHTTGESGQPLDRHYADMTPLWREVRYAPLYFARQSLEQVKTGTLVLTP